MFHVKHEKHQKAREYIVSRETFGILSMRWNPFAGLTQEQREQLTLFEEEFLRFNRRHNLISRGTEADFVGRHVRHVLALTRRGFPVGSSVVDWGSGGGLPAVPLAIAFPAVSFHAVDAVLKKVHAIGAFKRRLKLSNLHPWHGRAEEWSGRAHYSVSRGTASLLRLWQWHVRVRARLFSMEDATVWPPGVLCLKGGDLQQEEALLTGKVPSVRIRKTDLEALLGSRVFAGKVIVEIYDDVADHRRG